MGVLLSLQKSPKNIKRNPHKEKNNYAWRLPLHVSSIVYEVIRTISSQFFFFFFCEKTFSVTKHQNAKQTTFKLLEVFVRAKTCCLCCFLLACFCFVSWFWFGLCFWFTFFEIVLITSYTILYTNIWGYFQICISVSLKTIKQGLSILHKKGIWWC